MGARASGSIGPALRVGVIGARRRHQGIGMHLARFAARAGADVVAVAGTSPHTLEEARAGLARWDLAPRGYVGAEELLGRERLDVLVIASPMETHDRLLGLAAGAGLHALCEKPLVWGTERPAARARAHGAAFLARGLHLGVVVQWPLTLPTYRALFPGVLERPPRTFHMRLSPNSSGARMLPDALPHALSLLLAVLPGADARIEEPGVRPRTAAADDLEVTFTYRAAGQAVQARVDLVRGLDPPRVASYAFDGMEARRSVQEPGYRLFLEGGGRILPLADPTPRLVAAFLARVSSARRGSVDPHATVGMRLLEEVAAAWREPPPPGVAQGPAPTLTALPP